MRNNEKRRHDYAKRKQLFEQLRLQSDILCDSNKESEQTIIINRMMLIILDIVGRRGMNATKREALANHLQDCAIAPESTVVELGGESDRDMLSVSGSFSINALAQRLAWSGARTGQTIEASSKSEVENARN